ncbi:unsaturated glucuronyl hydrolase [Dactylonectria estremocensis]|uniref:Unsaturated glucuronyl hydrolase n=1 Tax=Dactylonectria estremocensis TaxID=1079267 RepID=A0A9P9FCW7_9HYPO|nr:unsaturated glucuronyl hydrolase [Dactylonectria estremocensis]
MDSTHIAHPASSNSSTASEPTQQNTSPSRSRTGSATSWSEDPSHDEVKHTDLPTQTIGNTLPQLFSENIAAKVLRTAAKYLHEASGSNELLDKSQAFPEIVPQKGPSFGQWELRDAEFWTCGFFPGTVYALLERSIKHPHMLGLDGLQSQPKFRSQLASLAKAWSLPLQGMAKRTDTHDIGFIVMPALRREWELTGDELSLQSIVRAAQSLATRYVPSAKAIRSWDCLLKKDITVTDMDENILVIIDSLCNLDLLFYASAHSGDGELASMAANHARTMLKTHLRPETTTNRVKGGYQGQLYSTCHVANLDPASGKLKWRRTAQGYSDDSTWTRGQAWAILGYAQTYMWTKDREFLDASCGVAEYFLQRLESSPGRNSVTPSSEYVVSENVTSTSLRRGKFAPVWDFDAPVDGENPLRDSSAGVIAANGMLVLSQALNGIGNTKLARHFQQMAINIVRDTLDVSLADEMAQFRKGDGNGLAIEDVTPGRHFESLLKNGTANNNQNARRRYCDHGLVYGDYYLVEFGNRLLNLGLI